MLSLSAICEAICRKSGSNSRAIWALTNVRVNIHAGVDLVTQDAVTKHLVTGLGKRA